VSVGDDGAPRVTLVVCTRDRAAYLPTCLDALRTLRPTIAWELVLVDNGSVDETPRLLAAFGESAPFRVSLVRESRAGLANAHNAGVRIARGAVIAFIDDDCYPAPDLLDRWAQIFADESVGFAGGRVLLHDPDDAPVTIQTSTDRIAIAPRGFVAPGIVKGANMAFRRDALRAARGFDPALGPGGSFNCEDVDTAARVAELGYAGGYFPEPTVRHHHRRRLARDVETLRRSYAYGSGAYYASLLLRGRASRALASHLRGTWRAMSVRHALFQLAGALHYLAYRARHGRARASL